MLNKCCRLYAHSVSLSSPDFHVAVGPGACRRPFRSADGLNWERERDPATWGTETSLGFFISERVKVTSTESSPESLANQCMHLRKLPKGGKNWQKRIGGTIQVHMGLRLVLIPNSQSGEIL